MGHGGYIMPFGIKNEGFWGKKELSYQHVHLFWAFWVSYIAYNIYPAIWIPAVCGILCGLFMEFYQYYKYVLAIEIPKSWLDSIRDLCFWSLGGCLNYIIIFSR